MWLAGNSVRASMKQTSKWRGPRFKEATVSVKKLATWAGLAFLVWWVVQQPTSAAHLVHNIGTFLSSAANGLSHFVTSI